MLSVTDLPTVNAALNTTSALLLSVGFLLIRLRRVTAHKICMLAAFGTSSLFLLSYLTYHYQVGSMPFRGQGWIRPLYYAMLLSHTVLAVAILPLSLTTLYRAWKTQFVQHVRIARWTLPIWLYVSVTGVLIYVLLYHVYP
ncbi:MAG: DUF420 domain-containing protein [Candidatus Entotheonellia bacterium]